MTLFQRTYERGYKLHRKQILVYLILSRVIEIAYSYVWKISCLWKHGLSEFGPL